MRRIQIKIWPELTGYLPAIIPFERVDENKVNPIDIDFSNVSDVESASLNIILIKLIKNASYIRDKDWDIKLSQDKRVNRKIVDLGFTKVLNKYIPNNKLFLQTEYLLNGNSGSDLNPQASNHNHISYPIREIDFGKDINRRNAVEDFKDYLVEELQDLYPKYGIKVNKLIQILHEISKNIADHTDYNGFFGLDVIVNQSYVILKFSLGDLGEGINQNVRSVLKNDESFKSKHVHLAITDSYNYALSMGFTSKPYSMVNRGIGMSTIFDLSKQINLKLSVFDAKSRGLLSNAKNISHVELRRVFYNIGFSVGFYYYGELIYSTK